MRRALVIAAFAVGLAACAGGDEELRLTSEGVFSCDSTAVRVSFDPTTSVRVAAGDAELATATFTERRVSNACDVIRGAPRTTAQRSPYDADLLGEGVYRRVQLDCAVSGGVRIYVHPIFNTDIERNDGSVLLLVDGRTTIVLSAVLKNKGDPLASRVYHAPRYCAAA